MFVSYLEFIWNTCDYFNVVILKYAHLSKKGIS